MPLYLTVSLIYLPFLIALLLVGVSVVLLRQPAQGQPLISKKILMLSGLLLLPPLFLLSLTSAPFFPSLFQTLQAVLFTIMTPLILLVSMFTNSDDPLLGLALLYYLVIACSLVLSVSGLLAARSLEAPPLDQEAPEVLVQQRQLHTLVKRLFSLSFLLLAGSSLLLLLTSLFSSAS